MNCLLCQAPLSTALTLEKIFSFQKVRPPRACAKCLSQFKPLLDCQTCRVCGRRAVGLSDDTCLDCHKWRQQFPYLFVNQALFEYNAAMKDFMKQYKFLGDYRLRAVFNQLVTARLKQSGRLIVTVPIHPNTFKERGFNQVLGLCEGVQTVSCLKTCQITKHTRQSEKDRAARLQTAQPFEFIEPAGSLIRGKAIIIVDDVYTTGTTIRHAASLLYQAGADSVTGLTLAR